MLFVVASSSLLSMPLAAETSWSNVIIFNAYRNKSYRDTRHLYILYARVISGLLQAALTSCNQMYMEECVGNIDDSASNNGRH